ncbi:hypothetical protein Y032_0391g563 [Ancylostoma ceylanicum]|nr:hypothetical protein Y032_0391g563 [Ancylostoma ceylanicum]
MNGTSINAASEEDVRIYKKKGKPPLSTKVFECIYKGDDEYEDVKGGSPVGCVAALLTDELECESLVYGMGLLKKDKANLCWMSKTGMVCAVKDPGQKLKSVVSLMSSLQNHQENIAKCASKRILEDYRKDPSAGG